MDPLVARLRAAGCVFAEDEARLLREAASGTALEELVRRRTAGEPLEHLLGFVDFDGHRYAVAPGVFVPRQRSVVLVREAVRLARLLDHAPVVLDLCCGCGALGLAVQHACGGRLHASDIDPVAVACARRNGVVDASVGDLFSGVPAELRGTVDLLVVNAPYVPSGAVASMPPEARGFEPLQALDGGPDGLTVQRRVLAVAPAWLAPSGHLLTETSRQQVAHVEEIARGTGLVPTRVVDDERGATVLVASAPAHLTSTTGDSGVDQ